MRSTSPAGAAAINERTLFRNQTFSRRIPDLAHARFKIPHEANVAAFIVTANQMAEAPRQTIQSPEWEHIAAGKPVAGDVEKQSGIRGHAIRLDGLSNTFVATRGKFRSRLDRAVPPDRKYLGLKRKWFFLGILLIILAIIALVIGLPVGLMKRVPTNLPLPGNTMHFTGDLTYYDPGLGSCGITSSSSEDIVAVSHWVYDAASVGSNPNANPLCGKRIRATRFNEKAGVTVSVDLKVVDRCVGCQPTDIDVTTSAFSKLANIDSGRVTVTWAWLN